MQPTRSWYFVVSHPLKISNSLAVAHTQCLCYSVYLVVFPYMINLNYFWLDPHSQMTRLEKEDRSRTNKLCAYRARQIITPAPNTTMSAQYGLRGPPLDQCVYICFFSPLQVTSHPSWSWRSGYQFLLDIPFLAGICKSWEITQGRGMAAKKPYREVWTWAKLSCSSDYLRLL